MSSTLFDSLPDFNMMNEDAPGRPRWSSVNQPPKKGDRVRITENGLGEGVATGRYLVEHGYLNAEVKLDSPPSWWTKQHPGEECMWACGAGTRIIARAITDDESRVAQAGLSPAMVSALETLIAQVIAAAVSESFGPTITFGEEGCRVPSMRALAKRGFAVESAGSFEVSDAGLGLLRDFAADRIRRALHEAKKGRGSVYPGIRKISADSIDRLDLLFYRLGRITGEAAPFPRPMILLDRHPTEPAIRVRLVSCDRVTLDEWAHKWIDVLDKTAALIAIRARYGDLDMLTLEEGLDFPV